MAVLSQSVIDAGARVGQIVKYYETVAALLASTDTVAEGEFVQAEHYFYKGAASGATDHHVRMNGGSGSKLYCIANPYVTPDQFGATPEDRTVMPFGNLADSTTYVQAALNSGLPVFLNRLYRVTGVYFPDRPGVVLHGAGRHKGPTHVAAAGSGLYCSDSNAEYILKTFPAGELSAYETGGHSVKDFAIWGVAKRGLVVGQNVNSVFSNIYVGINASGGVDTTAVVYEQAFSNVFIDIEVGGGCKVDLRIGQTCLDTEFIKFTTVNPSAMHHIEIDNYRKDLAYNNSAGNGLINFKGATLQGSRSYAIKMRGQSQVNFYNTYTENIVGFLLVKDCDRVNFYGGDVDTGGAHAMWLDQVEGSVTAAINFFGTEIRDKIVVGNMSQLNLYGCDFDLETLLVKTNSTYKLFGPMDSSFQLASLGDYQGGGANLTLRCTDNLQMSRITVNSSGTVSGGTGFSMADVNHNPISTVAYNPGGAAFNPTYASGAPITPFTIQAKGGTGSYTYALVSDGYATSALPPGLSLNASTGQISGTPTTPGEYVYKVRVTDSGSGTSLFWDDTGRQTITVT